MSADTDVEEPDGPPDVDEPEGPPERPEWLSLDEGETVEWVGGPASVSLVPAAVWGLVLLPVLGLGLVVFLAAYLNVANTDFVVTNTTLYHKQGVLSTNIESVGVDRIQNTEYSQSFSGKQLGYGTIEISSAGSSGADVTFRAIENPREVRDLVAGLASSAGAGGTGGHSDAGADAGGDQAELLGELATELRAINESMTNVERLLREERGGTASAGRTSETDHLMDDTGATGGSADAGTTGDRGRSEGNAPDEGGTASEFVRDDDDDPPPTPFGGDEE